jgi:hypothetical protein
MMQFEAEIRWDNGMSMARDIKKFSAPNRSAAFEELERIKVGGTRIDSLKRVIPIKLP